MQKREVTKKQLAVIILLSIGMLAAAALLNQFFPAGSKQTKETWDWREIHHYLPLKKESFDSIYFGINIEQTEKEKIIQYVRKELNPQIRLYQMKVDENAFRLRPVII